MWLYYSRTESSIFLLTSAVNLSGPEDKMFDDIEERISATKKEGESDMDCFERRFQERVSNRRSKHSD